MGKPDIISGALPRPFGKYTLTRELGRGAMGAVFEARDSALDRRVALKLMLPSDNPNPQDAQVEEQLFTREAQLAGRLEKHPNIVSVYEAGTIEGRRYIAMEHIDGLPLSDWTAQRKPSLRARVKILRDVARAVHHAHKGGILHRDLKPKNVLVDPQGRPYVTDFGMAKRLGGSGEASGSSTSSSAGTVVGTPSYMSPEQAQGLKKIDARTDVYALGAMLYEMLTGSPPFPGEMTIVALMRVVQDSIPAPSAASPEWAKSAEDKSIEGVCMQALSKNPDDRFPDAMAFADRLSLWLGDKAPPAKRPEEKKARNLLPFALPLAIIPLVIMIVFFAGMAGRDAPPPSELLWTQAPDLLRLVDPAKDAASGAWTPDQGAVVSGAAGRARLEIPWRAPEEYDLRVTFVRRDGADDAAVVLPWRGASFVWTSPAGLQNGVVYTVSFRVRKDGLSSDCSGKNFKSLATVAEPGTPDPRWALRDAGLVGLGSDACPVEFKSVQVLEVSGKGARTRP